ncbi:MAG: hypothetical protein M3O15_00415 [Acidobacteriota bacterium]|nr:hypothetical protein [Acidobacteriota bacterium]
MSLSELNDPSALLTDALSGPAVLPPDPTAHQTSPALPSEAVETAYAAAELRAAVQELAQVAGRAERTSLEIVDRSKILTASVDKTLKRYGWRINARLLLACLCVLALGGSGGILGSLLALAFCLPHTSVLHILQVLLDRL